MFVKGLIWTRHTCVDIIVVKYWQKSFPNLFLCIWGSIIFITSFFYQKCYMSHFLIYKFVCMIWLLFKYFLNIFLYLCVSEAIWVSFWSIKGIIWKFMVYFTLVIFSVTSFFSGENCIFRTFILEFKPLPAKNPWHVIYCWIWNFK